MEGRQGRQQTALHASHEDPPTSSNKSTKPKAFGLGTKRGASSPNIPCCSRDEQFRYPVPKMHKEGEQKDLIKSFLDNTSSSMPNIGPTFGSSLYTTSQAQVRNALVNAPVEKEPTPQQGFARMDIEQQPGPSNATAVGLYEELLASSTFGMRLTNVVNLVKFSF